MENKFTDGVAVHLSIGLRLIDRIKLLFGRELIVKFTLETENKIGKCKSDAVCYVGKIKDQK